MGMRRLATLDAAWRTWHRPVLRICRWTAYVAATLLVLGAAALVLAHSWLPTFASRKDQIAKFISQRSSYRVQIDRSEAYWHGLNPGLRVYGLTVYPPGSQEVAVRLKELRITLAWLPLLAGQIQINNLVLVDPDLSFERLADGTFRITGLAGVGKSIPGQGSGFLPWLFQQNDVSVQDGEVEWIDYKSTEPPLRLAHVNLSLQNSGNRHRLQMSATFPRTMCQACSFLADVTGNPFTGKNWEGEIDVQAEGLNTYVLPKIIRSKLPAGFDGRFNVNISSQWSNGVAVSLYGHAGVAALKLALSGIPAFDVKTAAARVNWTATSQGGSWTLQLDQLRLGLVSSPWSAGELRIEHNPYANHLFVQHVDVDDVDAFLERLKGSSKLLTTLRAIHPGGAVNNLRLRIDSKNGNVSGYAVEADMNGLRFDPYGEFPGVHGLTGHVSFGTAGGELVLASQVTKVALPLVFRRVIDVQSASGRISWERDDRSWRVNGKDLHVVADGATLQGHLVLRLPDDSNVSPHLDLQASLTNGNLADATRYYPNCLSEGLRDWLSQSVGSGTVSSGQVVIQGTLSDFPFRDGNGRFQVSAHIKNGVFRYLAGWPKIVNIDADLLASGPSLSVAGRSGNIRGLSVRRVAVTINDLAAVGGPVIQAVGQVTGPVDQTLSVLYASQIDPRPQLLVPGMHASGQGVLSLDLAIPTHDLSRMQVTGVYQLRDAAIHFPLPGVGLKSINGSLQFDRNGLNGGSVRGNLLGGEASLAVSTRRGTIPEASIVNLQASGTMTQAGLQRALGNVLGSRLSGDVPWNASLQLSRPGARFDLAMDLKGMGVQLPQPLDKPIGAAAKLTLQTRATGAGHQVLDLHVADKLNGRFVLDAPPGADWKLTRATVEIGGGPARLVAAPGLRMSIDTPQLDADRWWHVIRALGRNRFDSGFAKMLTAIDVRVGGLHFLGRSFGAFQMSAARQANGWLGTLNGDDVAGHLDVRPIPAASVPALVPEPAAAVDQDILGPPPAFGRSATQDVSGEKSLRNNVVNLVLQRLTIPQKPPAAGTGQTTEVDPRLMPELHLQVQNFQDWGKALGQLEVAAVPAAQGWHIQSVHIFQHDLDFSASGDWQVSQAGDQSTHINMQVQSADLGRVLDRLGYGGNLAQGHFQASGQWDWAGGPASFSAGRLNGSCALSLKNGRLPKISPGSAGRLLGLIDTRALTRYLTLDFSNVFGKGFTFDSIGAKVTVQNGNAYTKSLTVKGPSATIDVSGRLGLAARDMDLNITVVPRLGDQLTVTGMLLGGPVVGAAVAVFRNMLKGPLEQTTETQYAVTGSWDNPKVIKGGPLTPLDLLSTKK